MWSLKKLSQIFLASLLISVSMSHPVLAKNKIYTGMCVCKKKGNVKATYSATTECTKAKDHPGCDAAKQACLGDQENINACNNLGGTLIQSTKTCKSVEC
ncbi:hypothetical protein Mnod_3516 [Methylobacterium nodulans ORS 2060]|uniref:Uncharacterized protein n=1 Tax=Methylobacterium nodulans (strain LMG 21967 / CNCM I-2342 / ORS 2060) TaxID=460265 RepID=B8INR0_METNO|nr:hypothetical protein Mnod_3516 [Methylobacterium nodulans ORS 2060]